MDERFTEKDWKLFRQKVILWQEQYMEQLNGKYIDILNKIKMTLTNFRNQNIESNGIQLDSRRSTVMNILKLLNDCVIETQDLEKFSETVKNTIKRLQI